MLEKTRQDMLGGSSIVFTSKTAVHDTFKGKPTNLCKYIVGTNASQLYPYSMCQPTPTGLYNRWEYDSETKRFTPHQNISLSFENMVPSESRIESNVTTDRQKKLILVKT